MKIRNRRWGPCAFCGAEGWEGLTAVYPGQLASHDRPQGGRCLQALRRHAPSKDLICSYEKARD